MPCIRPCFPFHKRGKAYCEILMTANELIGLVITMREQTEIQTTINRPRNPQPPPPTCTCFKDNPPNKLRGSTPITCKPASTTNGPTNSPAPPPLLTCFKAGHASASIRWGRGGSVGNSDGRSPSPSSPTPPPLSHHPVPVSKRDRLQREP